MAEHAGEWDADERGGARAGDAGEEVFQAHAGVDDDGHRAEGKQGEGGGDERQALAHHEERAVTGPDAGGGKAGLPRGDLGGEFGESEREVIDVAGGGAAAGDFEGGCRGLRGGHEPEVAGDIGVGGRSGHGAAGLRMAVVGQRKTPRWGGVGAEREVGPAAQ